MTTSYDLFIIIPCLHPYLIKKSPTKQCKGIIRLILLQRFNSRCKVKNHCKAQNILKILLEIHEKIE